MGDETLTPAEFVREVTGDTHGAAAAPTASGYADDPRFYVEAWEDDHHGAGWALEVSVPSKSGRDEDGTTIAHGSTLTPAEAARARDAIRGADALLVRRCAEVVAGLGLPEGWEEDDVFVYEHEDRTRVSCVGGNDLCVRLRGLPRGLDLFRLLAHAIAGGAR